MTLDVTTASPPTTVDTTSQALATMAALNGVSTDYNKGSQIRTFTEAMGAVVEQQGVWVQATAFQAAVYGALQAFGIFPETAVTASGTVTFATSFPLMSAAPVNQNVAIPSGTIVQTAGGIQFGTTAGSLLASGSISVDVGIVALIGGIAGNVTAASINQIVNGLNYPLSVLNVSGTLGGVDAESPSQTLARFAAERSAVPASTPNGIANAVIGVTASGSGETVRYSTLEEPWITGGAPGWNLYLDNGSGTASSDLIAAVNLALFSTPANPYGIRDAGVPYAIYAVSPTVAVVSVTGTVNTLANTSVVSGAIAQAVSGYFVLPFGVPAEQSQIAAVVANASLGALTSLTVALTASGSLIPTTALTPAATGRVILGGVFISIAPG